MLEGWQKSTLGKHVKIYSGNSPSQVPLSKSGAFPFVKVEDLNNCGKYQFTGRSFTNERKFCAPAGSVIFPKRGAAILNNKIRIASVYLAMDTNLMAVAALKGLEGEFLYYLVLREGLFKIADTSTIPQLNNKHINPYVFDLPPIPEQRKIAEILRTWDEAIERLEALRAAKEHQLEGFTARLIHGAQAAPQHLREHLSEVSERNLGQCVDRILSVTNSAGFVLAEDQFAHRVASADTSNYKIVRQGQYAYNPSRINVGSIARLDDWPEGALSPMYVVFELRGTLDSDFFSHWLRSGEARKRIALAAQGSVRNTVSFGDLGAILLPLPPIEEQRHIARALSATKEELSLLDKEVEALTRQKRGLMQKLLTGEWRVQTEAD